MNIIYILEVLFGFGFLIAIHEAGHFMAARRAGITCPVFSVGFPLPAFVTKLLFLPDRWRNMIVFTKGGTEYRVGWIPFGGFVQMKGQNDDRTVEEEENTGAKDDFRNVSYGNKVLVIMGGVIMNAITGIVFFVIAFMVFGVTFIDPVVGGVVGTEPTTGKPTQVWIDNEIQPGDRITAVNGKEVVDFEDVFYMSIFGEGTPTMSFERPDGSTYEAKVPKYHEPKVNLDMAPLRPSASVLISSTEAERSDGKLEARDKLLEVGGHEAVTFGAVEHVLSQLAPDESVELTIQRGRGEDKTIHTINYVPKRRPFGGETGYLAGMAFELPPVVEAVRKGAPGDRAGLKSGDLIRAAKSLTGSALPGAGSDGWREVSSAPELMRFMQIVAEEGMMVRVERDGSMHELTLKPEATAVAGGRYAVSISFMQARDAWKHVGASDESPKLKVADVLPGSAAARAGITPGMTITDVPGVKAEQDVPSGFFGFLGSTETTTLDLEKRLMLAVAQRLGAEGDDALAPIDVQVKTADDEVKTLSLEPKLDSAESTAYLMLDAQQLRGAPVHYGFIGSVEQGFYHSHKKMRQILRTLGGLFAGDVSITHLGGPVIIAKTSYDLADFGLGTLLFFLGFISINLAVVNLLPIPVLDGGLLLVVTIEKLKGSPLNETAMGLVNLAAFLMIIGFMVFIVFNDLRNILS